MNEHIIELFIYKFYAVYLLVLGSILPRACPADIPTLDHILHI